MIKIEYLYPKKLNEIKQVHDGIKKLVANIAKTKQITIAKKVVSLDSTSEAFVNYLNDKGQVVLNGIFTADATTLASTYIKDIETKFPNFIADKAQVRKRHYTFSQVRDVAYAIFVTYGYDKLKHKEEFYAALDVKVCPYCNRTLIEPINDGKDKKTMVGELDHYYCKSRYPYLAVSLYNLVPSCGICNGKARKGENDLYNDRFQNPYLLKDNDGMKFAFKRTKATISSPDDEYKRYYVKYSFVPNASLRRNFEILKLKKIYSGKYYRNRISVIEDVVNDFCNQSYIDEVQKRYVRKGYTISPSLKSLLKERLDVSNDKTEYSQHINNKFTMDVFEQMRKYIPGTLKVI